MASCIVGTVYTGDVIVESAGAYRHSGRHVRPCSQRTSGDCGGGARVSGAGQGGLHPGGEAVVEGAFAGRITDAEHRLAMVRLAIADCPHFEASAMEVERPGLTYTVDTLAELRAKDDGSSRGTEMYLILGMDSVRELRRWHEPRSACWRCALWSRCRARTPMTSPLPASSEIFHPPPTGSCFSGGLCWISARPTYASRRQRTAHRRLRAGTGGAVHPRPRSLPRNVVSCASQTRTPWRCVGDE